MSDPRSINPSRCWIRHVRRTAIGETGAPVGQGAFIADTVEDLGGRQGWQSGTIAFALSDDGEGTFRFPNAAGDDGRLHRTRFALLTEPAYRIGEEWLEVYRDADELVAVITPKRYSLTRSELIIAGPDVAGVLSRFRSTDLEPWLGAAPRDVFEHYTRAPILCYGSDLRGLVGIPASGGAGGTSGTLGSGERYVLAPNATVTQGPDGETVIQTTSWSALGRLAIAGSATDCWVAEGRIRCLTVPVAGTEIQLQAHVNGHASFGIVGAVQLDTGDCSIFGTTNGGPDVTGGVAEVSRRQGLTATGSHTLRLACFYDRVFLFVDGELAGEVRRPAPLRGVTGVYLYGRLGTFAWDSLTVRSLAPFALRGPDKGDYHLPGVLPAVGLRARIYNAASVYARYGTTTSRSRRLPDRVGDEPALERLDPVVDFAAGAAAPTLGTNPAAWIWTGAIYLDLAASDRRIRLTSNGGDRLFVGKTRPGIDAATDDWQALAANSVTAPLRSLLGSNAGWYPIRIEAYGAANGLVIDLEDGAADAGGVVAAYATVPQSRLSPIGTYDELVRLESHREILTQITEGFGYQWRVEPRQLESGEFPGQIIPRVRVGQDYDLRITVDRATDVAVEGDAGDAVDVLVADAAGIADPKGSGQLSAELIDLANARAHSFVHGDYESLADISEAEMLQTRLSSLLALRSSVNENVGARPDGQRDLLDTFPLTGASSRMDWRPGDGGLLDLPDVGVDDTGPRQLTRIEWPIVPDGFGRPAVGFRQRPRNPAAVLRRALRVALNAQRNYQGTLVAVSGSQGAGHGNGAVNPPMPDFYTRLPWPPNPDAIAGAYLHIEELVGTWTIEVVGVNTGIAVTTGGRYDVMRWMRNDGQPRAYARLINADPAVGASFYAMKLVMILRV